METNQGYPIYQDSETIESRYNSEFTTIDNLIVSIRTKLDDKSKVAFESSIFSFKFDFVTVLEHIPERQIALFGNCKAILVCVTTAMECMLETYEKSGTIGKADMQNYNNSIMIARTLLMTLMQLK